MSYLMQNIGSRIQADLWKMPSRSCIWCFRRVHEDHKRVPLDPVLLIAANVTRPAPLLLTARTLSEKIYPKMGVTELRLAIKVEKSAAKVISPEKEVLNEELSDPFDFDIDIDF